MRKNGTIPTTHFAENYFFRGGGGGDTTRFECTRVHSADVQSLLEKSNSQNFDRIRFDFSVYENVSSVTLILRTLCSNVKCLSLILISRIPSANILFSTFEQKHEEHIFRIENDISFMSTCDT